RPTTPADHRSRRIRRLHRTRRVFLPTIQALEGRQLLSTVLLSDGGFESPSLGAGSFQYDPAGTPWTFVGGAGVSGNGSAFTSGNPDAPEGTQVGFLQVDGAFSQVVTGLAAGTYALTF